MRDDVEAARRAHAVGPRILPRHLAPADGFALAAAAGFSGVEMLPVADPDEQLAVERAVESTGVRVSSVEAGTEDGPALLDREGDELEAHIAVAERSIRVAAAWAAPTVLLVPGRIDAEISAETSWSRSADVLSTRLVPLAEEAGVTLGIENTWYSSMPTAHELARFVDEQESPAVGAYFDPGNVIFGHPEHWVPVLGHRIVGVHYKDFAFRSRVGLRHARFAMVGSGDVDWLRMDVALADADYAGWLTHSDFDEPVPVRAVRRLDRAVSGRTSALSGPLDRMVRWQLAELGRRAEARDAALARHTA